MGLFKFVLLLNGIALYLTMFPILIYFRGIFSLSDSYSGEIGQEMKEREIEGDM